MSAAITLTTDVINTKQRIISTLCGMTDAIAMMDLREDTDLVETLREFTADCQELLNLVHNLQAWAERTDEAFEVMDHIFPEHNVADLIRWDQITKGVEVPF
jgi:hypothetical protein